VYVSLAPPIDLERRAARAPFFSICIPQYNRTSFLIEACRSLMAQSFTDFEVCISDDQSTDGRAVELIRFLENSGLAFAYRRQSVNVRYDANLRGAIALARGRFAFLLGNDDGLACVDTLDWLHTLLEAHPEADVAITNYTDYASKQLFRRVTRTAIVGSGPRVALGAFRNYSFVSGVILRTDVAQALATERWDGSEMYQMFVGTRIVASGGKLLYADEVTVRKDIQIVGESVDSYAARPRLNPCPIVERRIPLTLLGRLVADALEPAEPALAHRRSIERIFRQLYAFTFPFWIVEYRRVQTWRYALGICLGLRPRNSLAGLSMPWGMRMRLSFLFWATAVLALLVPEQVVTLLQARLYRVAKATG
jgi:hypothetical protein